MNLTQIINTYLTDMPVGCKFDMRDICGHVYMITAGSRNPLDSTVGRIVRKWRANSKYYDIICIDHGKALYQKIDKSTD